MIASGYHANLGAVFQLNRIACARDGLVCHFQANELFGGSFCLLLGDGVFSYEFGLVELAEHAESCHYRGDVGGELVSIEGQTCLETEGVTAAETARDDAGGEKSFVAIALYFAIMKVRPTPFCIMDEIDAALDEANLERYAAYMRTMTGATQFIVITHHRATMEEADMLYGVTMQEKGVTTVLNVDLDEAERTIAMEQQR